MILYLCEGQKFIFTLHFCTQAIHFAHEVTSKFTLKVSRLHTKMERQNQHPRKKQIKYIKFYKNLAMTKLTMTIKTFSLTSHYFL